MNVSQQGIERQINHQVRFADQCDSRSGASVEVCFKLVGSKNTMSSFHIPCNAPNTDMQMKAIRTHNDDVIGLA